MYRVILSALCVAAFAVSCSSGGKVGDQSEDFAARVDQYIGTGDHGHVFMGANVPFGAVQLGPSSIPQSWDWCSGYHISDTTVIGFSHTHLSGTGIGDLGDISLMPTTGDVSHARGVEEEGYESGLWSYFSRVNEACAPGYYATRLDRWGVDVELTATARVGFHKYTFPADAADARVVLDLSNGQGWDAPTEGFIKMVDEITIEGYRYSQGWANDQRIFFVAEFSRPFSALNLYEGDTLLEGDSLTSQQVYAEALFGEVGSEPLYVKVALSPVSIENARENLDTELSGWDFDATKALAREAWNTELSKIKIKTSDQATMHTFYTALYHSMIAPSVFSDVNGDYRGADGKYYENDGFTNYTTFSLWDTYRAAHPLMTIIHPEKMPDIINTMLHIYQQQGKLPVWHLMGCETNTMVGNPAIPVVADAILKDFGGFDRELAYEAMKTSAMLDERGLDLYREYGYIPWDQYNESVATCLEYALADWALGQVAKAEGKTEDYEYFDGRSKAYRHYFDPTTRFLRGKSSNGEWHEPFNPFHSTHRFDDYTEGNAWQYTWLVPHDVEGLAAEFGGMDPFHAKLDSLFVVSGDMGENASPDISGLVGQYAHGNEPSHHILYLYTMTGQPHKTADLVRKVLSELYHDRPGGLSGNEDVGQMSSWYILSSLGFYQAEPAGGRYWFGSPIVDEAAINVGDGKTFTVKATDNSTENKYIQNITLNGMEYTKPYIDFTDIAAGGELVLTMGSEPAKWY
jgi:predicted alpha-1,2-mannosidase